MRHNFDLKIFRYTYFKNNEGQQCELEIKVIKIVIINFGISKISIK